ncbi:MULTISPECIES: hypothetical protein [unclassified Streptomyces]|uniref:hypothetical protein n=1 Tax=unclassified Streptomyces TaxID=2593676 RepID=UPI0006B01EE2|nr:MULTISPECIES: hypothetical protein [unclassified Streptomyces]KOX20738.1 hypothetical protein ADL06_26780 [Streptomyces sp. NRRL F-6491]KOX35860.1 hypothetical protein ADL08_34055 [Streptomyces sp. NRRL F-6492]
MRYEEVRPDARVICHSRGDVTGTVLHKRPDGFGKPEPVVCIEFDNGGVGYNYPEQLSPLAPEDDERDPKALPRMTRQANGYTFWRGGTLHYVYRYVETWRVMEWSDDADAAMPLLVLDCKTRAAAVRELIAKVDAATPAAPAPAPVVRPELRPDMRVKAPARGEGCDAIGVVLTMRTPPAEVPSGSVYVMWHLGAPSWIAAEELVPTGDLPGSPNLLDVEYGSRDGEGVFWRGGEEYRVIRRYPSSSDGPWDVSHRAADGTLTRIVEGSRTRNAAHHAAVVAIFGFEDMRAETVSYLAVAETRSGQPLRVDVPGADGWGRVSAPTAELALSRLGGAVSGLRYDVVKRRDVRRRIGSVLVYPVRRDGSLGVPRMHTR